MDKNLVCIKKNNLNKIGYDNLEQWMENPNHVYIGRDMTFFVKAAVGSKWQNPFSVKKYGRDRCLQLYEKYLENNVDLINNLHLLENKILGCWCDENEKCHGQLLLQKLKYKK